MFSEQQPPSVGPRLLDLRKELGLTLDALSAKSGVSRSMLSQIERGQANPTLATVWNLARALDLELTDFVGGKRVEKRGRIELTAASFVPEIRTEDGQCEMRILSPANTVDTTELYHLKFEPGGDLVSDPHARGSSEHLSVLMGELTVKSGDTTAVVGKGGIARYPGDVAHAITNHTDRPAEAILAVISS